MPKNRLTKLKKVVAKQAEDWELWFIPVYVTEDLLQQALRKLHTLIEDTKSEEQLIEIKKFIIEQRNNEEQELWFIPEWQSELVLQNALKELYALNGVNPYA